MFFFMENSTATPFKALASTIKCSALMGVVLFCSFLPQEAQAQIEVFTVQQLSFGAFALGNNGGTLSLNHDGTRTATGDIILVNQTSYYSVLFEIEAPLGSNIHIQNGPDVGLQGTNGGEVTLSLGDSSTGSPFVTQVSPPDRTTVAISTTLTVGGLAETPPGDYQGSFSVTFIQE